MPRYAFTPRSTSHVLIRLAGILGLFVVLEPATANVVPAAFVYFNVVPVNPYVDCESEIWECDQMQQTTPAQGLIEFEVYIAQSNGDPVTSFTADMTWPYGWTLVDGAFCRGGVGSLQNEGANPHRLEVNFPCASQPYLFMALDLIFWVEGYGKLTTDDPHVWIGCPPEGWSADAASMFGEAGTDCEYTNQPCDYWRFACEPRFDVDELALTAGAGETAHGEILFHASGGSGEHAYGCHGRFHADTGENWCVGQVLDGQNEFENILVIDADAADLDPGVYETWVQVESETLARCVQVTLEVIQKPTVVSKVTWGALKALYR